MARTKECIENGREREKDEHCERIGTEEQVGGTTGLEDIEGRERGGMRDAIGGVPEGRARLRGARKQALRNERWSKRK